jgi:hypothetical protein
MRFALAALLLTGCVIEPPDSGPDYPPPGGGDGGWGSGWGGSGGNTGYGCRSDAACGSGNVCARDGSCTTSANVRVVHANWTTRGVAPSEASCTSARNLDITFSGGVTASDHFGFSPVPCKLGKFTVDKLPMRYTTVTLARAGDYYGGDTATFDSSGNALLDLQY